MSGGSTSTPQNIYSNSVQYDSSGNICVIGGNQTTTAVYLIKYSPLGIILWQVGLGFTDSSGLNNGTMVLDSNDNIHTVVCVSSADGVYNLVYSEFDTNGNLLSQHELGNNLSSQTSSADNIYLCDISLRGNDIVISSSYIYTSNGNSDLALTIINNGSVTQTVMYSMLDQGMTIGNCTSSSDSAGNLYLTLGTYNSTTNVSGVYVVCMNSSYAVQWCNSYSMSGQQNIFITDTVCASNGDIYTGFMYNNADNIAIMRLNRVDGSISWARALTADNTVLTQVSMCGLCVDSSDNLYINGVGSVASGAITNVGNVLYIAEYSNAGALQWQNMLYSSAVAGVGEQYSYSFKTDASYGTAIAMTGFVVQTTGVYDMLTMQLQQTGADTGTYGSYTYTASTMIDSVATITVATAPLSSVSIGSISSGPATLTNNFNPNGTSVLYTH